jgi:hypothetical protein
MALWYCACLSTGHQMLSLSRWLLLAFSATATPACWMLCSCDYCRQSRHILLAKSIHIDPLVILATNLQAADVRPLHRRCRCLVINHGTSADACRATAHCLNRLSRNQCAKYPVLAWSLKHPQHHRRIEHIATLLLTQCAVCLLCSVKTHDCTQGACHRTLGSTCAHSALLSLQWTRF